MGFEFLNDPNSYTAKVFVIGLQSLMEKEVKKSQENELERLARVASLISLHNRNKIITDDGVKEFYKLTEELLSDKEDLHRRIDIMFNIVSSKYDIIGISIYDKLIKSINNGNKMDLVVNFYKLYKRSLKQQDHSWIKQAVLDNYKKVKDDKGIDLFDSNRYKISLSYNKKLSQYVLLLQNKKNNRLSSAIIIITAVDVIITKRDKYIKKIIDADLLSLEASFDTMIVPNTFNSMTVSDTCKISKPNKDKVIKVIRELCSNYKLFEKILADYYYNSSINYLDRTIIGDNLTNLVKNINDPSLTKFAYEYLYRNNRQYCNMLAVIRDTLFYYMKGIMENESN